MTQLNRRAFIGSLALTAAFAAVTRSGALAQTPKSLDQWAQDLADLNRDLTTGKLTLVDWQDRIGALNTGVELEDLRRYLDFDRLTKAMTFPTKLAETADPHLPTHINVDGIERPWFIRFFGMRKGGAIIPHVHNNMVSSHLIVDGQFHARTFDRMVDLPDDARGDTVLLRPARNETMGPGAIVTMSDERENSHWLIAEADRSFTFDVGLVDIAKDRAYTLPANKYNMIFVDPTGEEDGYGLITAPVITFEQATAKFAA
ncbi:MAG: hypothetical protein SGI91_17765 [Alphaproteobacteria bacterium]|nr:hypothetical protein [Alphaproteobacteria bacterium]